MLGIARKLITVPSRNFGGFNKKVSLKNVAPTAFPRTIARSFATGFSSISIPPTKISTLPNNMRIATEEGFGETATIGVFIDAGSVYDTDKNSGVAHFLEHMTFKGTTNRTRERLEVEIENMGGTLNAYTSREQTVYYMKVFKNDVPKAVEILSDILTNSTLEEANIEAERGTILREMEEVAKDHGETIFDHLHSGAFQGTPLGRTILGPAENIKRISKTDLIDYIKNNYQGPRMVLAGAGGIKHEELVALGQKHFSSVPSSAVNPLNFRVPKPEFTGSMITVRDDDVEAAHVVISMEGVSWSHPDYFTFLVVQQIIGSWDRTIGGGKNLSSRLCETVATEGLATSITAFNTCYNSTGIFGIYAVTDNDSLEDLSLEVMKEFNRIGKTVLDSEVERAKNRLKASLLMALDGTTAICEDIGRQLITIGRRLTPAEVALRIDSISTKDVMRVAREHFEDVDPSIVAIGTVSSIPDYNMFREWTYWRRW